MQSHASYSIGLVRCSEKRDFRGIWTMLIRADLGLYLVADSKSRVFLHSEDKEYEIQATTVCLVSCSKERSKEVNNCHQHRIPAEPNEYDI